MTAKLYTRSKGKRKPKFKVGQVVAIAHDVGELGKVCAYLREGWWQISVNGFIVPLYENRLRALTKWEAGR